jgi:hypothetical protein
VVIAFDGFRPDMSGLNDWLSVMFIEEALKIPNFAVILCGHEIPERTIKERAGEASRTLKLQGVHDAHEWLQVAEELSIIVPGDTEREKLLFMKGILAATAGVPGAVLPIIKLQAVS